MPMFKRVPKPVPPVAAPVFVPDGQRLPDGSVRYKILCDGGISPSGVFWEKTVPPGASESDYRAVQAKRDEVLKGLREMIGSA